MHRIRTATYFASPVSYSSPDHHPGLAGLPTPVARSTPTPESVDQASEFAAVAAWSNEGDSVTFSGPNAIAIDSQDNVYLTEFGAIGSRSSPLTECCWRNGAKEGQTRAVQTPDQDSD